MHNHYETTLSKNCLLKPKISLWGIKLCFIQSSKSHFIVVFNGILQPILTKLKILCYVTLNELLFAYDQLKT